MENIEVKVEESEIITDATPVVEVTEEMNAEDIAEKIQSVIDSFEEEESSVVKNPKGFLHTFMNFIQSASFVSQVKDKAKKYNVPAKRVAQSFIGKVLGVIGDVLGLTIDVVNCGVQGLVNLIAGILNGAMSLIARVAGRLARIVTFNMTACRE